MIYIIPASNTDETKYKKEIRTLIEITKTGTKEQQKYARKKLLEKYGVRVFSEREVRKYEKSR